MERGVGVGGALLDNKGDLKQTPHPTLKLWDRGESRQKVPRENINLYNIYIYIYVC
jgi:hypothetical protein